MRPSPVLELLLACDGAAYVAKLFEIHKTVDGVKAAVGPRESFTMGRGAAFHVICHADVEIARAAGQDVDPEAVFAGGMAVW